jgi:hypothetical protein
MRLATLIRPVVVKETIPVSAFVAAGSVVAKTASATTTKVISGLEPGRMAAPTA